MGWGEERKVVGAAICKTCGDAKPQPTDLCGRCAWEWNTPNGKVTINRRRKANGLPPLESS